MANEELRLVIKVDPETGKLQAFNSELGKIPGTAEKASSGLTSSFLKSQIAMEGLRQAVGLAIDAFKDGIKEIEKDAVALSRLKGLSDTTDSLKEMVDLANELSADNLVDFAAAASTIADLKQKGFSGDELKQLGEGLKNIAAAAGGSTADNLNKISEAFLTGRTNSIALQQMLPSLREELDKLPKSASPAQEQQALLNTALQDSAKQADAAKDKLKTLQGQMEAFGNASSDLKKAWAEGVLEGLKATGPIVGNVNTTMGELKTGISGLATAITTVLVIAFKTLKEAVDFAMIPLNAMVEWFIAAPGVVNQFRTELMRMAKDFESFGQGLVDAIKAGIQAKWDGLKSYFSGKLQDLRDLLPHSDAKTGPLSTLTQAGAAFWTTFAGGLMRGEGSLKSALMSGLSVIESTLSQTFSKMFSGLGKMWGGLLGGALATGIMAAVGLAINAIANAFKHDWLEDVGRTVSNMLPGLELTEETLKKIAQEAEKAGDAMVGTFLSLRTIMDDVGVSAENVSVLIGELRNGFSLLETGAITSAQLIEVLEDTFADLAAASTDSLGLVSAQFKEIIALAQQFGIESQAITDFLNSQLQGVAGGVNQVAQNINVNKQGKFDLLQTQVLNAFNAMIANGATVQEAMDALGPSFDVLSAAMEKFGFEANAALDPLFEMMRLAEQFPRAFAVLDGVNAQLVGLANTNNITRDSFKTLEQQAKRAFNKILQDGSASEAELRSIAPTLQLLQRISEESGITLSKQTQKLIEQAEAYGLMTDPAAEMQDTLDSLNTTLTGLTDAVNNFTSALQGIPTNVNTTITTDYQTAGVPPAAPSAANYSGGGSGFNLAGGGQQAPTPVSIQQTVPIRIVNEIRVDGTKIGRIIVEKIERGEIKFNIGSTWPKLIGLK